MEAIQQLSRTAYHYRQLMSPLNQKAKNYKKRSDSSHHAKRVHKIKYRLTEAQIQDVLRRYEAGEASAKVGKAFGISKTTVISILNEHGIAIRKLGLTDRQKRQASRLRQSGLALNEIARQLGVSYGAAQRFLALKSSIPEY
ncbi:helix-turn-helix domain-containing protein [Glutamicibacter arilaitensis]|uniref:Helix-turn-helix domain-containing protein n=1 Tax=Glutamicibacter arilaitensis TaxID=256701 RepID=A0A4Y8TXZ6_9MICC|nr:hypothetical protein [Glutamicibacter arilaitensis]TFH57046.1 hypothetical protein EXY26_08630 [Glutamicibacter arilaitensis]